MSERKIAAELVRKEQITSDIFRLTLQVPEIASAAAPGQFVMLKAGIGHGPPLLRRPFSIHNVSIEGTIQILFKVVGGGTFYLSERQPGEILSVVGPLGRGYVLPGQGANVCLVGGGMGIAPLFYLARKLLSSKIKAGDIKVLIGAASAVEIKSLELDFSALGPAVFTATDDGSTGHHGLVTDLLSDKLESDRHWLIYSCGPQPMMRAVATDCLRKNRPCQVSMETMMACGISACLGCAIPSSFAYAAEKNRPYLHVCKDGPVFEAGDVKW